VLLVKRSGAVYWHSVPQGELLVEWSTMFGEIRHLALSSDDALLAMSNNANEVRVFNPGTGACLWEFASPVGRIEQLTFSNDSTTLVFFDSQRRIYVSNPATTPETKTIKLAREHRGITFLKVHPRAQFLVSAQSTCLSLIDLNRNEVLTEYHCDSDVTTLSEITPRGLAVCGTRSGQLHFIRFRGWCSDGR
jgi:WD40 repeat protein